MTLGPTRDRRFPWNKGKLTGAKPPRRPKHVWSIRTRLQIDGRARDLAMFNLAIDSKLRGCDFVALKVEDVAPNGYCADRATVRQRKTRRPVRFELTEHTRQAVDDHIRMASKKPDGFLFTASRKQEHHTRRAAHAVVDLRDNNTSPANSRPPSHSETAGLLLARSGHSATAATWRERDHRAGL